MKLSTDTWHYRNFDFWRERSNNWKAIEIRRGRRQPDLCTYTRIALVWGPLARVKHRTRHHHDWMVLVSVFSSIWFLFGSLMYWGSEEPVTWWFAFLAFPGGIFLILATIAVVAILGIVGYNTLRDKSPSIITERVRAHKQQVCPLIEFYDPVEEDILNAS